MRALFLCSALGTGGAENQLAILLPRLAERGFESHMITLRERGRFFEELQAAGIPTHCLEMRSRYDIRRVLQARWHLRRRPQLVVTHEINAHVVGSIIARRVGAAHIAVDHAGTGLGRAAHRRLLERLVIPGVDHGIGVSRTQLEELVAAGYQSNRLSVISNGVPPLRPTTDAAEMRAHLGIEREEFLALLVATNRPEKRIPLFIEAVGRANQQDRRIRGVVAGRNSDLPAVQEIAKRAGAVVSLLGERADIADLMKAADAVCLTSSNEGLPITLIEAMSLGRPIVTFDVGGVREIIGDGEAGVLVAPQRALGLAAEAQSFGDALVRLSNDGAVGANLGTVGRRRYERLFTADRMADEYAKVFRMVLARSGQTAPATASGHLRRRP